MCVLTLLCLCSHHTPATLLPELHSDRFVSVGLLSWPLGLSVSTDSRTKFTSAQVTYIKHAADKL